MHREKDTQQGNAIPRIKFTWSEKHCYSEVRALPLMIPPLAKKCLIHNTTNKDRFCIKRDVSININWI